VQKIKKIVSRLLKIFGGFLIFYVLVYAILSTVGRYEKEPIIIPSSDFGILWWAPFGFYNSSHHDFELTKMWCDGWNRSMVYTFYPLWKLDRIYLHKNYLNAPPDE
jgi:hypothetical protein